MFSWIPQFHSKKNKSKSQDSFICGICLETLPSKSRFRKYKCNHSYCSNCISEYIKNQRTKACLPCPSPACNEVFKPPLPLIKRSLMCLTSCPVPRDTNIITTSNNNSNSDLLQLMKLAENKGWKSCPNCKSLVELMDGCCAIRCKFVYILFS